VTIDFDFPTWNYERISKVGMSAVVEKEMQVIAQLKGRNSSEVKIRIWKKKEGILEKKGDTFQTFPRER
jgi:hypothetical protein